MEVEMTCKSELRNFIDHYGLLATEEALAEIKAEDERAEAEAESEAIKEDLAD